MTNIKNFIKCFPNILDNDTCEDIISTCDFKKFKRSVVNNDYEISDDRKVYENFLDPKFENIIFEKVGNILNSYSKQFKWFLISKLEDTGYKHLCYKGSDKGEFKMHVDSSKLYPRVLSISFILNDNYDGGDFLFFDEKYKIEKKKGMAIVFPSNFCFPHAVTPVTNGDRHAIITWIR
jgi:predicted 2-oxoglutarate/Fe(II)-dependent dioxygenase YbiX|tara:strand:- start:121 stop:654 length:534 start_codon:yes stop_codon:yes gene_type:complete